MSAPIFGRCLLEKHPSAFKENLVGIEWEQAEPEPTIELNYRGASCRVTYSLLRYVSVNMAGVDAVELNDWLERIRSQMAFDARPAHERAAMRLLVSK